MKKIVIMLFVAGCAAVSQAAYLYWQVSSGSEAFTITEPTKVNAAALVYGTVDQSGNFTKVGSDGYYGVATTIDGVGSMASSASLNVSAAEFASYTYYIELYNYIDADHIDSVGVSQWETYTSLSNKGFIDTGLTPVIPVAWTGGSYAAPEPTSAVLMLIGLAGLALKRRNV